MAITVHRGLHNQSRWSLQRLRCIYFTTWPDANQGNLSDPMSPLARDDYDTLQTPFCWFKADDLELSDGDLVSSWDSDGVSLTQGTSDDLKPVFKSNIINGHSVVRFDGVDDFLQTTTIDFVTFLVTEDDSFNFITEDGDELILEGEEQTGLSTIIVFKQAVSQFEVAMSFGDSGYTFWTGTNGGGSMVAISNSHTDIVTGAGDTNWHAMQGVQDFDTGVFNGWDFENQGSPPDIHTSSYGNNILSVGGYKESASLPFGGDIAEIMVFDVPLNGMSRTYYVNYIKNKYALD